MSSPASGRAPSPLPGIRTQSGFRFRRGQYTFLSKLADALRAGERNHLGVFVPGYGKTITALASFVIGHSLGLADRLVVFVPRGNLRDQYADPEELTRVFRNLGAPPFSFCVADSERVFLKNLDTQIIITTYQYASGPGGNAALLRYCQSARAMFIFDEVHHLSDDGLWAEKIQLLPYSCTVALSGTPMRSDNKTLFGVPFEMGADEQQYYVALHEVTMRDAHEEGNILKRVEAHVVDYRLKMVRSDTGQEVEMTLSRLAEIAKTNKEVDAYLARRKLRFHEVYLDALLGPAFACFAEKRRRLAGRPGGAGRNHQMLIIAMSNRHAAAILDFVRDRFPHYASARIGQDVAARERLALLDGFRGGQIDVMVQVDMIGEGTDIKPISVIVKADLVRAYSKTMQQVFRGMRYLEAFGAEGNQCDIFAANDSEVVGTLEWITSEEQIGVKLRQEREKREPSEAAASEHSVWELTDVQHREMRTHTLDLFGVHGRDGRHPVPHRTTPEQPAAAVDVRRQEQDLRKECAALATELAFLLQSSSRPLEIRQIHAEAKRRFSKAQDELSIGELQRKRDWLQRCIRAGRMV